MGLDFSGLNASMAAFQRAAMPPPPPPEPTFWQRVGGYLATAGKWALHYLLAPGVALLLVAGAILLVSMGAKDLQIGGLLAKLFGKKSDNQAIDVANTVPTDRIGTDGKILPIGTPDSKGMTQAVVVPIENTGGLFSNPDTVTVTPPGTDTPIEVTLPDGVKASDVSQVVIVQPGKFVVTVKDSSGIPASRLDELVKKYGKS